MYDTIVKTISLTEDELEIAKLALERYEETSVSRGETLTIEGMLEKFDM